MPDILRLQMRLPNGILFMRHFKIILSIEKNDIEKLIRVFFFHSFFLCCNQESLIKNQILRQKQEYWSFQQKNVLDENFDIYAACLLFASRVWSSDSDKILENILTTIDNFPYQRVKINKFPYRRIKIDSFSYRRVKKGVNASPKLEPKFQ